MLGAGKKTQQWERIRRILKIRFEGVGLTYCEVGYKGCWRDNGLSFAHYDKRRFLNEEQLYIAVLACANCHPLLERLPRHEMTRRVLDIIRKRTCQGLDRS